MTFTRRGIAVKKLMRAELHHLSTIHPTDRLWQMSFAAGLATGLPLLVGMYVRHGRVLRAGANQPGFPSADDAGAHLHHHSGHDVEPVLRLGYAGQPILHHGDGNRSVFAAGFIAGSAGGGADQHGRAAGLPDHTSPTVLIQARFFNTVLGSLVGLAGGICLHSLPFRDVVRRKTAPASVSWLNVCSFLLQLKP